MTCIRFSAEDLESFSVASHDRNPLHLSDDYARRSPFGDRVVFGVLSTLQAIGQMADVPQHVLAKANVEFFCAAAMGIDYSAEADAPVKGRVAARIRDGLRPVLDAAFQFRAGHPAARAETPATTKPAPRTEALDRTSADLAPGTVVHGTYEPDWSTLRELLDHVGATQRWIDPMHIAVLLWSSYLVGMEMPGRRALFGSLAVEFHADGEPLLPFEYEARVIASSPTGEYRIAATITRAQQRIATVTITAMLRDEALVASASAVKARLGVSDALRGRVALVTGASRGLGATLAQALALQGATVVGTYWKSRDDAEQVREAVRGAPGQIVLQQGDAGDPAFWAGVVQKLELEQGRLDFLICNASPPIQPLWLEPCAIERLNSFVIRSLSLISAPSATLLPLLAKCKGWSVLISSSYVSELPRNFPHYNAAKAAAEALLRTSIAEYRQVSGLITRPPKLLTDQTNTPIGKKGAIATEIVAATIVARLKGGNCPGKVELLDQFM